MNKNDVLILDDKNGENFAVQDSSGKIHKGTVVIKAINCGKGCKGCPHKFYKYVCWKQDGKTRWKYIGVVKKD